MDQPPGLELSLRITAALEPPIEQGTWDGQRVGSKSGAFGDARLLARLFAG